MPSLQEAVVVWYAEPVTYVSSVWEHTMSCRLVSWYSVLTAEVVFAVRRGGR